MTVSDNTIQAESLGDFFNNLGKEGLDVSKKIAKNVLKTQKKSSGNRSKRWNHFRI